MNRRTKQLLLGLFVCLAAAPAFASDVANDTSGTDMIDRMMLLVIQFGVIIFAAKFGNILFSRIKLPGALGELVIGIVIGPYALGQLGFLGFAHGLFPAPISGAFAISPELYGLSAVAAVVLMFNVGLETNLRLMLRFALAGGLVGLGGILAGFVMGASGMMIFSKMVLGEQLGFFAPQCLLLGTITTATSVGITARVLADKHKLDSPEGVTIISAAVIDDVLGVILLAVVMGVVTASGGSGGTNWEKVGVIAAKAIGVWGAATIIGLVAARKISFLLKWFKERTSIAVMALGLALILAGLFEEAGLAMIIGAYVMGLSLSKADISHVVQEKLAPVYTLLVPVFFCTMGMQLDLGALTSWPVLVFGLAYAAIALLAKVIGCGLAALLANFNLLGAARIGFGMAPRCEVALIIASVGLAAGLLNPAILAAVIIMVVVNTVVAPPVLAGLFNSEREGTRKPVPGDKTRTTVSFEFPSIETTEFFVSEVAGVFESEGFFVHQISRQPVLYHLRKEGTVIDFQTAGTTMTFTCRRSDVPLVNATVYEALAALEHAIRGLRKPIDQREIQSRLLEGGEAPLPAFDIADYLNVNLIEVNLKGGDRVEIIKELLGLLVRAGRITDAEAAFDAVWEREESMSTGLQDGVAIPHGKSDSVERLICAVGIKPEGVDFKSLDGQPSQIIILTLSPKSRPAPHVQFMSTVSQLLSRGGRERLLACRTARQIHNVLTAPAAVAPMAKPARPMPTAMNLEDYIKPELVQPHLSGGTPEQIIRELMAILEAGGVVRDPEEAARVVLEREAQLSTGMEEGVAVPHGRTDAVDQLICAVGVNKAGVDFGAVDGKPSKIFLLVLTPISGSDPYMQFVAQAMTALDAAGRKKVLAAETPEQLCQALTGNAG